MPKYQAETRVLSNSIAGIEFQIDAYNSTLLHSDKTIKIAGPCLFVRGVHNHLEQNFQEAIRYWRNCRDEEESGPVALDANYWIGYENNNMGQFKEAILAFDRARMIAEGDRSVELMRLTYETRFFEFGEYLIPDAFVERVAQEFNKIPAIINSKVRSNFATTVGNIYFVRAARLGSNAVAAKSSGTSRP